MCFIDYNIAPVYSLSAVLKSLKYASITIHTKNGICLRLIFCLSAKPFFKASLNYPNHMTIPFMLCPANMIPINNTCVINLSLKDQYRAERQRRYGTYIAVYTIYRLKSSFSPFHSHMLRFNLSYNGYFLQRDDQSPSSFQSFVTGNSSSFNLSSPANPK